MIDRPEPQSVDEILEQFRSPGDGIADMKMRAALYKEKGVVMPETQIAAILAKLEMILVFIAKIEKDHDLCRKHCDGTSGAYHREMQELRDLLNKAVGSRVDPKWIYAIASAIGAGMAIIGLMLGIKGGLH